MDFRKKLKTRLYMAIGYIVIGIIFIALCFSEVIKNEYLSSLGFALFIMGIARVRQYKRITKDEESIRRQKIAETDERNISISNRAKSAAFAVYISLTCIAVIILEILNKSVLSSILATSVCVLVLIYWISYWIIRKKS